MLRCCLRERDNFSLLEQSTSHLSSQPRRKRRWKLGWALLLVYVALLSVVVFWPVHVDANVSGDFVQKFLHRGHQQGWLPSFITYQSVEWFSNVLMFIPGGFLLTLMVQKRWRRYVPWVAMLTTVVIETVQRGMPGRTSSLWDIVANSLGGTIGWASALLILQVASRSRFLAGERKSEKKK